MVGRKKAPLGDDQVQRILGACRAGFERQSVELLIVTGMHISVLPKLTPENLVERGGQLKLEWRRPKTGRMISVSVPDRVKAWLKAYLSLPTPPRWKSDDYYYKMVKEVARRAGQPEVSPMSFRHTAGYNLHRRAGPSAPVKVLGVSPRVAATYASLEDDAIDNAAKDILGGILDRADNGVRGKKGRQRRPGRRGNHRREP